MTKESAKNVRIKLRMMAVAVVFFCGEAGPALAGDSALAALRVLPVEEQGRLARIERPDGALRPERWYFDVYAEDSETGLREYVVAEHKIVANREVSQFSARLTEHDVLDSRFLRADSTDLEKLAKEYASANNQVVAAVAVTLAKPVNEARPVWTARCLGASGEPVGSLIVAAENGTVFAHEGFSVEPNSQVPASESGARRHGGGSTRVRYGGVQDGRFEQARQNWQSQRTIKNAPTTSKLMHASPNGHFWLSFLSR